MPNFAAIQMASGPNISANLNEVYRLVNGAVTQGAKLVVLPENFAFMGRQDRDMITAADDIEQPGEILNFLSRIAREFDIWILGGTIALKSTQANKVYAASLLYNHQGEIVARYNKMHLFDIDLGEKHGAYQESAIIEAGNEIVVTDTPFGKIGIAVCYDIRFPELFRRMQQQGMQILLLPAAFTQITGKAHWEIVNRSRAIENLCYVVAANQGGFHVNGRETHGNSMIINPWGKILDQLPKGSGFVMADINLGELNKTRKNFPVLKHRRLWCGSPEIV